MSTSLTPSISWDNAPHPAGISGGDLVQHGIGGFSAVTDLARCLLPLLQALKWRGIPRHVAEALPHFADTLDIDGFLHTMAHLNYGSSSERLCLRDLDPRLLPCLFVPDREPARVVTEIRANPDSGRTEALVYMGSTGETVTRFLDEANIEGSAWFFTPVAEGGAHVRENRIGWFRGVLDRFRGLVWQTLFVSTLLSIMTLIAPLFVMAIYDKVLATHSIDILMSLMIGASIALASDGLLRIVRARMIAHFGARLGYIVGTSVFERILGLASTYTERTNIGSQIARLRNFESVKDFFTGPLAISFFELPFVFVQIIAIGVLGGIVSLVPLGAIVLFAVIAASLSPIVRNRGAESARNESRRQEFLVEALTKLRNLRTVGAERIWAERYRDYSAEAAISSYRKAAATNLISSLAHTVVITAGILTLALGVTQVLAGEMSVGALIACMILVWRAMAPLQTGFMLLGQFERIRASTKQIDTLMKLKPERDSSLPVRMIRPFDGRVTFNRVSMRYGPDSDPALVGVTFDVRPGQVVAVVGPNGCGKSTLLKMVAGLYVPQAGSVLIDGNDIRQIDPAELRHAIGYVPQVRRFFHGTISQNLRLANPTASDEELYWATGKAGALEQIRDLPDGFETRLGDTRGGLSSSLAQKISLARAYIKRPSIMLFDEAAAGLDYEGDREFMKIIQEMRGGTTVFMVTHRPSHLRLADGIVVMEAGTIKMAGPAAQVLAQIPQELL